MNQLTKFLVDGILNEGEQRVIAAYGGGFKPPTAGHFEVVKQTLKNHPEIDEFIIYVGSGTRDGITQAESVLIWEIYQTYLPMKVRIEPSKAPIGDILRLGKNNPQDKVYFVLGAREENEGDFEDIKNRTRAIGGKHPNVEVKVITTADKGMSGTNARKLAKVSFENFSRFLPAELSDEEKETAYNIVKSVVKESLNENASYSQDIDIKQRIMQLTQHMLDKGMNIEPLPNVEFVDGDKANAREFLGKTAYYDPNSATIVLYTEGRHPKDIVRSFSHEMIHHIQNLENRLDNITTTNTQEDDALNDIEAEANLKGTMTFRNWTDSLNEGLGDISLDYVKTKLPKLDSYPKSDIILSKGDFTYINIPQDKDFGMTAEIKAFDKKDGTLVAQSSFDYDKNGKLKGTLDVRPDKRRLGIATEIYKLAEKIIGDTIFPEEKHTEDAEKFWQQKNRSFGPKTDDILNEGLYDDTKNFDLVKQNPFDIKKLADKGIIFITKPGDGKGGVADPNWEGDASVITLKNMDKAEPWMKVAVKNLMPQAIPYIQKDQDKLIYNGKYRQILWSIDKKGLNPKDFYLHENKDPFGLNAYALELARGLEEEIEEGRKKKKDPKKGTGKKPKGSGRRLYTDEDPKDTVSIKFKTKEDIVDTLNKESFKAKSHARQSQIINLIHQRVRAAYQNAKDPDTKSRLKRGLDYITKRKEASKKKTQRLKKQKTNENLNVETTPKMSFEERLAYYKDYYINVSPSTFDIMTEDGTIVIGGLDKPYSPNFDEKKDVRQVPVNENVPDAKDDGKAAPYGSGYEKLNEGRYDTLANQLSKIAFQEFKDIHDRGDEEGTFKFRVDHPDEEHDIPAEEFYFDFEGIVKITDDEYNVNGGANVGFDNKGDEITPVLSVKFKIPKNPDWQKVSFDIKDVVRHELEHLTQDGENEKGGAWHEDPKLRRPSKYMQDDQFLRDLIDANFLPKSDYFKLEKEVDAMLQGMYFKAKKSKTPFKQVLNDYLDIFVDQGSISKEEKENILDVWRSRRNALSLPSF